MILDSTFSKEPLKHIYVDFNSYFASVEQQVDPRLRGKPVAVLPSMTEATCAIAASYEAKAFGIKTGTMIYEAKKMCPELICVPAKHDIYVDFHHRILKEVDKYIPIEKIYSIDEFTCELQGREAEPENARAIALRIKSGIQGNIGEYIKSSVGIAQNRFLAKLATEIEKPDGLVVLESSDLPQKLYDLKLSDICGIGRNMERRLRMNNIASIKDLYALSPKHMRKLWHSVSGERMWYNLRGYVIPEEKTNKRTVGHSHVLAPEYRPEPMAKIVAQRLTLKAASRLRRLGYYAGAMDVSIRLENAGRYSIDRKFHHACDNFTFLENLSSMWQELLSGKRGKRVKKISIVLHRLISSRNIQPDFFDDNDIMKESKLVKKHEKVSFAMDKLNSRFGRDTVVMGFRPDTSTQFSGTKVAFNRIPDIQEFHE